jgi:putative ABC transport system ATP-binding protein
METIIALDTVTRIYESNPQPALNQVSLDIYAGQVTAIMGPSGSGKSTLLNLVAGLDRPSRGTIRVDGTTLNGLSEAALARYRRSRIGLIFQFFNLLNNLTVLENVLIPAQLAGISKSESRKCAADLLEQLGIADQRDKYPARLSGGQRQRVAIARALINRPALLLADEPTGALDTRSGEGVLDLFRDLQQAGQTVLLITHDPKLASRYANRVVRVVDGAVAEDSVVRNEQDEGRMTKDESSAPSSFIFRPSSATIPHSALEGTIS